MITAPRAFSDYDIIERVTDLPASITPSHWWHKRKLAP